MPRDIQLNERVFSFKEVTEEVGIATPIVRKYGQIFERNGYEFLKDGDRRNFVQSDIGACIALPDMAKTLDDTAKDLCINKKKDKKQPMRRKLRYLIQLKIYHSTPIS
jgi:hypothetical protein